MPLAAYVPDDEPAVPINVPVIAAKEYKSVVVDSKNQPLASLITYVGGASWTVDYFAQVLDTDDELRGQDSSQSSIYQQYRNIKGMELKVQSPLSSGQDDSNSMQVVGSATVYPFLIPNKGDMFAADVGDGREGVFMITTSEQKSFMKQSVYTIEYQLQYYSDVEQGKRRDLDAKVVQTLFYLKDFLLHGQNPLLIEEDHNATLKLSEKFEELVQNYMNWFFNQDYSTLTVPGQSHVTYDHYLVEGLLSILSTRDAPQVKFIKRLNVDGDYYLKQPNFWKALTTQDRSILDLSNRKMGLVQTSGFSRDPMLEGIAYSGIDYMVYPANPDTTLNSSESMPPLTVLEDNITTVPSRPGSIEQVLPVVILEGVTGPLPVIAPVNAAESYVLSMAFYQNEQETSLLEVLVNDYFSERAVNPSKLLTLANSYKNWGGLERYYYIPIVLVLIRSIIRNT